MENEIEKIWDYMVNMGIATEEELKLISAINGYNLKSIESVLYARTGYHDLEQIEGA